MAKKYRKWHKYYLPVEVLGPNERGGITVIYNNGGLTYSLTLHNKPDLLLTADEIAKKLNKSRYKTGGNHNE